MDEDPNPPSKPLKLRPSLKRASVNPLENLDVSNEPQNATLAPRRVSFAASAAIKPFAQDPEVNTIWDNSYETSIAHADSNVASLDMISNVQESNVVIVEREIVDRENIHVTRGTSKKRVIKDPLKPIEVNRTVYDKSCEMEMTCHGVQPEIFMPNNVTMYQDFEMSMTCNFRNEIFVAKENVVQPRRMNATQLNGTAMMDLTCPVPTATIMQSPEEDLEDDSSMEVTCNFSPNILVNKTPFTSALHLWEQQNSEESSMELMCKEPVYDVENVKPKSGLSNKTFVEEDAPFQASSRNQRSILKGSGGAKLSPASSDSSMEMTCKYPENKSIYDDVENIKPKPVKRHQVFLEENAPFQASSRNQRSILKGSGGAKLSPASSDSSMEMTCKYPENKSIYDNVENIKPKSVLTNKTSQKSILKGSVGANLSPASSDSSMEMTSKYPGNKSIYDDVENIKPKPVKRHQVFLEENAPFQASSRNQRSILKGSVGARSSPVSSDSSMEMTCKYPGNKSIYDNVENIKPTSGLTNKTSQKSILKGSVDARSSPASSDSSMEMTCKYPGNKSIYDNVENIKPTSVLTNKTSQKSILKGSVGAKPSPLSSDSSMEMTGRLSENKPVYDNIENSNLAVNTRAQNRTVLETDNIYVDYSMERTYKLSQNETIEKQDKSLKGRNVTEQRKTENSCPGKAPAPALLENVEDMEMSFEVPKQRQPDKTLELSKFVALQTDPRKSTAIDKTWTFENNVLQSLQAEIKNSNVANVTLLEVTAPNDTKVSSPCGYNTMLALSLQEKTFDLIQTGQKLTQKEDSFSNILVEDLETQHCDFTLLPNISPEKVPSPSLVKYCQPRATSAMYSMNFSQFSNQLECSSSSSVVLPTIDDVLLAAFENPPELPEKIPLEPYEVLVQTALESLENLVCRIEALKSDQSLDPDSLRLPEEISDLTMRLSMNVTQASPDTSVTDRLDDSSQDSPERTSLHKQILKEFSCKDKDIIDLKRSEPNFYLFSLMCGSVLCSAELHPEDGFVMEFNKCSLLTGERDFFFHLNTLVVNRLMQKVEMSSLRSHLGRHFNMLTLLDFLYINAEKSVKFYGELMETQRKYITFDIQTTETNESILSFNILVANPAIHWTVEFKMASEESLREGSLVATSKYGAINEEHLQSIFRNTEPGSMCVMRFIGTVEEYFRRSVLFKEVNKLKDDMDNYVRFKLLSERKRTSSDAPAAAELKKIKL